MKFKKTINILLIFGVITQTFSITGCNTTTSQSIQETTQETTYEETIKENSYKETNYKEEIEDEVNSDTYKLFDMTLEEFIDKYNEIANFLNDSINLLENEELSEIKFYTLDKENLFQDETKNVWIYSMYDKYYPEVIVAKIYLYYSPENNNRLLNIKTESYQNEQLLDIYVNDKKRWYVIAGSSLLVMLNSIYAINSEIFYSSYGIGEAIEKERERVFWKNIDDLSKEYLKIENNYKFEVTFEGYKYTNGIIYGDDDNDIYYGNDDNDIYYGSIVKN